MAKAGRKKKASGSSMSDTHIRVAFHLSRQIVAKLRQLAAELKAEATLEGKPSATMSKIVEAALEAEIKRQRQLKGKK